MTDRIHAGSSGSYARLASGGWRRWAVAGLLCAIVQLGSPMRAYALFEWLDHLSGPGPFQGIEFQAKLLCVMNQPSREKALEAVLAAHRLASRQQDNPLADRAARLLRDSPRRIEASELLDLAFQADAISRDIERNADRGPDLLLAGVAWQRSARLLREASVPRVRATPGSILWATCRDNPNPAGEVYQRTPGQRTPDAGTVRRAERHPAFSLNVNYRFYTTGNFFFYGPSTSDDYAHGKTIRLQTIELQASWPLTGRFDILDGRAGFGRYRFTSDDFEPFGGLILEPVRFDLHFPARLMDRNPNPLLRVLYATSFNWGLVNFPGGFSAGDFNATGAAARDISGGEMIFERGIVVNVGRLLGM